MKNPIKVLSMILICSIALVGCGNKLSKNSKKDKKDKLSVTATIYPLYDFTKNIGGDKINLTRVIPNGAEPHDWDPSSEDIKNLLNSDILIYNGLGLENWIDKVKDVSGNKNLVLVKASEGANIIDGDSHLWLSVKGAKLESKNILNALIKADPKNKDYYQKNFETFSKKLDDLLKDYSEKLKDVPNKQIVVSHNAYGYLVRENGLKQLGIEDVNAESEPDAKKMKEIVDFVKKNKVKTIFFEDIIDPRIAKTIADEAKVQTEQLNPIESLTEEEEKENKGYIDIMKANLKKLYEALK